MFFSHCAFFWADRRWKAPSCSAAGRQRRYGDGGDGSEAEKAMRGGQRRAIVPNTPDGPCCGRPPAHQRACRYVRLHRPPPNTQTNPHPQASGHTLSDAIEALCLSRTTLLPTSPWTLPSPDLHPSSPASPSAPCSAAARPSHPPPPCPPPARALSACPGSAAAHPSPGATRSAPPRSPSAPPAARCACSCSQQTGWHWPRTRAPMARGCRVKTGSKVGTAIRQAEVGEGR